MYKKIVEGETLTVTGVNIYPESTQVFFNTTDNQVPAINSSFNSSFTQVSVTVPCCLPDLNKVILYNGINYFTGEKEYRFYGKPSFSGISDSSLKWGESALISGAYLGQTTGVTVQNVESKYYIESDNGVVFTTPFDIASGNQKNVTVKARGGEFTTQITVEEPNIEASLDANSYSSGVKFGESGFLQGNSLHRVNRIVITGYDGDLFVSNDNLVASGTSGLSFLIPEKALDGYPIRVQNQTGFFSEGNYNATILEEVVTNQNLKIKSPFISALSSGAGKYQDSITVTGPQVQNCKILFSGYDQTHVQATTTATGLNTNTVSVPRGIVRSQLIASGYTGDINGTHVSADFFYPIPTITGISTTTFEHAETVTVEAVNAAQARSLLGVRGIDKIEGGGSYGTAKTFIVSTPPSFDGNAREYGHASLNNSSLSSDITTGVSVLSATINSVMIGSGTPFLVSQFEGETLSKLGSFADSIINIPNYNSVLVSGKVPSILGMSKNRATKADQITISGNNLMNSYRLNLTSSSESKHITSGQFVNPSGALHPFVSFTNTGDNNYNNQTHSVNVNLSDFNFTGTNGSFEFVVPTP